MEASFNENFHHKGDGVRNRVVQKKNRDDNMKVSKTQVKAMINSVVKSRDLLEWNYWCTSTNQSNVNFTGTTYPLSDIPQGDSDSTRGGDSLSLVSLEVNLAFYASSQINVCRVFIYQWFPALTAGSPPAVNQLLYTTGSALAPMSPYNVDNHQQYKILFDRSVAVSTAEGARLVNFKTKIFPKKSIQYSNATTNGSSKLFLVTISDDGVSSYPLCTFVSKLYFIDA